MKQRFILFLVVSFITLSYAISAQEHVYDFEVSYRKADKIEGIKVGDYFFSMVEAESSILLYMINPLTRSVDLSRFPAIDGLLGFIDTDENIELYFTLTDSKNVLRLIYSKQSGKLLSGKPLVADGDFSLGVVTDDRNFMFVNLDKKEQKIIVNQIEKGGTSKVIEFAIADEKLFKHLKKNKFTFIHPGMEVSFDGAKNQNKIYFQNGKILLISDSWEGEEVAETKMVSLDLQEGKLQSRNLILPYDNKTNHNSFLFDNKLYALGIDRVIVGLNVYDINTFEKVSELRYLKGEPIAYKGSDLMENNKNLDKEWRGKWSDEEIAKYTLKILNEGLPVISVYSADSENNRLLLGRNVPQKKPISGVIHNGSPMAMGGGPISTPGGMMNLPYSYGYGPMSFQTGKSMIDRAYFFGYINKNDFTAAIDKKYEEHGNFNRAKRRINKLYGEIKAGGEGVINSSDGGYVMYLNKETKVMTIEKI